MLKIKHIMDLAAFIDHTILKSNTTKEEIIQLCNEANEHKFAAVCVPPYFVALAKELTSPLVKVATVIGFPMGYSTIKAKKEEIIQAIADGADELDFVINITALFADDWDYLRKEILSCIQPIRFHNKKIKIIIESGILIDKQIINSCLFYAQFKVDFIKTSTGFAAAGASKHAIQLMKTYLPEHIKIKASGGIRDYLQAKELIALGVERIGTSSGIKIRKEINA